MLTFEHIRWIDENGHIRPPVFLYLLLAFLGRGWVVFIASLTQFNDTSGLVRLFYPQKEAFLLALVTGIGAVLCYVLVLLERKQRPNWAMGSFCRMKWLLWPLLLIDTGMLISRMISTDYLFTWTAAMDAIMVFWFALYLAKSQHLSLYLNDWTKPIIRQ